MYHQLNPSKKVVTSSDSFSGEYFQTFKKEVIPIPTVSFKK